MYVTDLNNGHTQILSNLLKIHSFKLIETKLLGLLDHFTVASRICSRISYPSSNVRLS